MVIEKCWGPLSVDLMTLDSNTPLDAHGHPLKHFTPPGQLETPPGLTFFSQTLHHLDDAYVCPPLAFIGILLRFLGCQPCPYTIVVPDPPDPFPRRYWWPFISGRAQDFVRLAIGVLGGHDMLLFPTSTGVFLPRPLPWDLWAFRVSS